MSNIPVRSLSTRYASARLYAEAFHSNFYCCRGGSRILETARGGGGGAGRGGHENARNVKGRLPGNY